MCYPSAILVKVCDHKLGMKSGFLFLVFALLAFNPGRAETVLWDDFSDEEIMTPTETATGAIWLVTSGKFAADGSDIGNFKPMAGELNFGVDKDTAIVIDYGPIVEDSATTLKLDIRQSNESNAFHRLDIVLTDKEDGGAFVLGCSPSSEFFGTSGFALFDNQNNLLVSGLGGSALRSDTNLQNIELQIDPLRGMTVMQDGMTILEWKNDGSTHFTPDRLSMKTPIPGVSWFVKNVEVDSKVDQEKLKKISSKNYERNIR